MARALTAGNTAVHLTWHSTVRAACTAAFIKQSTYCSIEGSRYRSYACDQSQQRYAVQAYPATMSITSKVAEMR
jgi:hypothetical protein